MTNHFVFFLRGRSFIHGKSLDCGGGALFGILAIAIAVELLTVRTRLRYALAICQRLGSSAFERADAGRLTTDRIEEIKVRLVGYLGEARGFNEFSDRQLDLGR